MADVAARTSLNLVYNSSAMYEVPEHIDQIDDQMAAVLRTKTGAERLAIANGLFVSARRILENLLRNDHPDWDEARLQREVSRRMSHGAI